MSIQKKSIPIYDPNNNTGEISTIAGVKKFFSVTQDEEFICVSRGLKIGVAGDVELVFIDGTSLIVPMEAGYHPGQYIQINSSGTTATGLFYYI